VRATSRASVLDDPTPPAPLRLRRFRDGLGLDFDRRLNELAELVRPRAVVVELVAATDDPPLNPKSVGRVRSGPPPAHYTQSVMV
jgi:hypothetical protein